MWRWETAPLACPGHQHGAFFKSTRQGGSSMISSVRTLFRADMCNADVKLGDLLIHEGSAKHAQKVRGESVQRG